MSYAIIGLLFLLVLVFSILAAKTWHWVNIVLVNLIFITGVTASVGLSQSLTLRRDAMEDAKQAEEDAERLTAEANLALNGPLNGMEFGPESLRGRTEALNLEYHGRGRVWSSGTVTASDANRVFKFSAARGDDEQVKMEGMIVYAFADRSLENQLVYPVDFIGTFRVVSETSEQVELEAIFVAGTSLNETLQGTWSLFEKMPVDRRDAFKKVEGISDDDFDITAYREVVTRRMPAADLGFDLNNADDAKAYETLIDHYTFDGLTLGQIAKWVDAEKDAGRRINTVFEAAPEETFIEFTFTKKTDAVFEVDATANLKEDGNFAAGKASNPALQAGGKIAFAEGDTVLIDQLSAEGYQREGNISVPAFASQYPVTETDRYFFRQLKNYPFLMSNLQRQTAKLNEEIARVKVGIQTTDKALADANGQITVRDDIKNKSQADLDNFQSDLGVISALLKQRTDELEKVEDRIRKLRDELDLLYRKIHGEVTSTTRKSGREFAGR